MSSPMQGFIDQLKSAVAPNPNNPFIKAATQNNWNPGQFGSNVASDIGSLGQLVGTLVNPMIHDNPLNVLATHSQDIAPDLENFVKQTGTGINNTLGQPVNPQTGNLQLPSQTKAVQNAYEHPVNTALMAIPALKGLGKIGEEGAVGAETTVPSIETTANTAKSGGGNVVTKTAEATSPLSKRMISPVTIPDDAIAQYNSVFQIPRNIAQNMKIKPETVVNQLINDGITGKTLNELDQVAKNVTGPSGAFPMINRIILGDIDKPVNISNARDAAGFNPIATSAIDTYLKGSPEGLITTVKGQIKREFPNYGMTGSIPEGYGYATDLFDTTQKLDRLANMYNRKAYTVMGDLTNPEYERAGQAIQDVSNNIKDALDSSVTPEQYQLYKNDPRVVEQLQRVPVPMAKRWIDNAVQFRDGRSIQAPYVGLSKMVEDTKDAKLAAFTKWTDNMQRQMADQAPASHQMAQAGVKAVINPQGALADLAAKGLQKGLSKFDPAAPTVEDMERMKTSGESATLKQPGKSSGLPVIGGAMNAVKNGVAPIKTLFAGQNMVNDASNNKQDASQIPGNGIGKEVVHVASVADNTTPVKYSDIPSDVTQLQPNAQGQYTITSPLAIIGKDNTPLSMTEDDYTNQKAQLQKELGTLQVKYNPQVSAQKEAALQQLETKHDLSAKLQTNYDGAMKVSNAVTSAQNLLKDAPPDLLRNNSSIQSLSKAFDGKYATLAQQLEVLQKFYPVLTDSILKSANTGIATATLNQLNNQNAQFYYQTINGVTGNVPGVKRTQQPIQPTGLPPINQASGNGGSVQGQPLANF